MTAVALRAAADCPKFLLDTNVFRDLARGTLHPYEGRLLRVAQHRDPPLLWTCPTVCQEILCHIRPEEADQFDHFHRALRWMEDLCGNVGMAEDFPWALACGVFIERGPSGDNTPLLFNQVRRKVLKARTFAEVTPEMSASIRRLRAAFEEKIGEWKQDQARALEYARMVAPAPVTEETLLAVLTETNVDVIRRLQEARVSSWGQMRSGEDQKVAMREVIAFRLSQYRKAIVHPNYSVKTNDHNDGWLLPYTGAEFWLVTADDTLKRALVGAGCQEPRLIELPEALDSAEKALAE